MSKAHKAKFRACFGRLPLRPAAEHFGVNINMVDHWRKRGPPRHVDEELDRILLELERHGLRVEEDSEE